MQSKPAQKLELFANIAIILAAVLLSYFLIQKFLFRQNPQSNQPPTEIAKGTKISLREVDWNTNQKTLLLVLQKDCKFCTENMSFYKTLVEKSKEKGIKPVAVLLNSREESQQYLKENGVEIQEITQTKLDSVNVRGTPPLILGNEKGEVENSWTGKLPSQKKSEVIRSFQT